MIPSTLNIFITSSYYILSKKLKNKTKVSKEMIRNFKEVAYKGKLMISLKTIIIKL